MSNYFRTRRKFAGGITLVVTAIFVCFFTASNAKAIPFDKHKDNVWATLLAPVVDYGIFSERFPGKQLPQGLTLSRTPPPSEGGEIKDFDPKPIKPPEPAKIPVDPRYFDQPLACNGTVVNASTTLGNEDESFAAVNPTNTQNIVVFSNLTANSIHRSYTTNGGASWTHGTVATGVACCDAQAAWDTFGNLFMVYLNAAATQVNVILSTNGGATFSAPVTAGTGDVDQPSIAVGNGSVWVDWNLNGNIVARGAPITGLGAWGPFNAQQTIPSAGGSYGGIAVGPGANGGKVIVTYQNPTGGEGPATIYSNTDADGLGAGGFGSRVTVTATNVGGFDYIPAQSGRSIDAEAGVVWDATGGAFDNRIYLVYTDETVNENNDTEIYVRTSDTDGATWSAPVRINDDATTRSQFLPYIALDRTTGSVAVGFHDSRNDNGTVGAGGTNTTPNDDAEYFATYSTNGGANWAANIRLSGGWSNAAAAGASTDYGDYEGEMAHNGKFYAIWADNSNCDGTNPNGTLNDFDLYMGTLDLTVVPTATATNTSTSTPTNTPTNTSTNTATNTATQSSTATFTPTATPGNLVQVSLPFVTTTPGTEIIVPIIVGETAGYNITSYDLQITFDPAVVVPAATPFEIAGTLSSSMSITPNTGFSGHYIISAFQGEFLSGSGTLINLRFVVVGTAGQSTALSFEDYVDPNSAFHPGFMFNEGDPQSMTDDGSVTAVGTTVSGAVTYGNAIGAPSQRFVSDAVIIGNGMPVVSATTAGFGPVEGRYWLSGFGSGAYTVTPSKTGGQNGAINSFDAAKIAQHVAGINALTGNQLQVADVSSNGSISSFDAGEIANFVVSGSPIGSTGVWKFNPLSRNYPIVGTTITDEDFLALLIGEVSGNWANTGARAVSSRQKAIGSEGSPITVTFPNVISSTSNEVLFPVNVDSISNKGIISCEFDLRYDPAIVIPLAEPVDVADSVSRGLIVVVNAEEPGLLRVALYGVYPIEENGLFLNLKFNAVGAFGSVSPITFEKIIFNEGNFETLITNGKIEIVS